VTTPRRNFATELRPNSLSDLIGQERLVERIRGTFQGGNVPIGVLLTGSFGAGKTTIARILALAFNCTHSMTFGEPCEECKANEDMFNIIERNCAKLTKKEEMEELVDELQTYPSYGPYRIVILDELQQASKAAQNVILKPMEEKDSINIFIIGTSDPSKIEKAIKDRCIPFAIPDLNREGVAALVLSTMTQADLRFGVTPRDPQPLITALYSASMTSSRTIVTATELYLYGSKPEEAVTQVLEAGDIDFYALFKEIIKGNWDGSREYLTAARPTDAKELKSRLSAYFRDQLMKTPSGPRGDLLALFIKELAANDTEDVGLALSTIIGTIYRICGIVNGIKAAKAAELAEATPAQPSIH
jgi:DNA polymerase-3 subunit gamma/tau